MTDYSYRMIKNRLEKLESFIQEINPHVTNKNIDSPLEDIDYLSNYINHVASNGEKVLDERTHSIIDDEINQVSKTKNIYSCTPTFIIGNRRSGTTLLSALLDSHSKFCSIPENFIVGELAKSKEMETISRWTRTRISPKLQNFWTYQSKLIDNLYQDFISTTGNSKKRWFSKEFFSAEYLDKIDYIFDYQPRYIYVVRHGLDVSYSCAKRYPERGDFTYQGNYLNGYLNEWITNNELTMDFYESHRERCHLIKYENLVSDPENELTKLFSFLGEEFESDIFEKVKKQDHPGVNGDHSIYSTGFEIQRGKGVSWAQWPEPLRKQLLNLANNTLSRLGYISD